MSLRIARSLVCLMITSALTFAQDRGTITGAIVDSSGAAVPAAKVTVSNPATGFTQTIDSAGTGGYSFVYLVPGKYTVTTEKEGFRRAETNEIQVQVNTTVRVDITLQIGAVAETVEVTASSSVLQTERTDLGAVVDQRAIQQLPLFINGGLRSNLAFVSLVPGVQMNLVSDPDTTGGAPRIAGGQANGASLLVDGAESMSERRNDPQQRVVSAEAVEEFKVQTSAYSAEYGRSSNGVLNYTTKSGTNELHGSFLAQLRHEKLNAKGFFWGARGESVQRQHVEAANVGGPIFIPKLYDGRNKAFFFFAGERSRAKNYTSTNLISVANDELRRGDFRRYTDATGRVIPLYDPFDAGGNIIADANTRPRLQCNGVMNVICPERIHPIARTIHGKLPQPDSPGEIFNNTRAINNGSRTPGAWQGVYSIKGDYNFTEKLRVNGMFSRQYFDSYTLKGPIPGPLAEAFQEFGHTKYWRANSDYVIRPNLLSHFTFGVNVRNLGEGPVLGLDDAYRNATLMPGVSADKAPNYTKYNTDFGNYGGHVNTISPGRTYTINEQIAWIKGRHNVKFGFQYARVNYRRIDCNGCVGQVNFSAATTANPSVSGVTGVQYAGFLLGLASGGSFNYGADINYIFKYYAWYVQDDFKLSNKLTLNIGLRYDLPYPRVEENFQNSNFNPSIPNAGAGGLLGALEFAGDGQGRSGRKSLQDVRKNAFGPRFGLAYQLGTKTVIRSGGSILYDSNREDGNADSGIQGFGGTFNAPGNSLSNGIAFTFNNGFKQPQFASLVDAGRPPRIDPTLANGTSPSFKSGESGRVGYFTDYNFTVEHSFTPSTVWLTSFHANYGVKLRQSQVLNQLDPKYIPIYGNLLTVAVSDPRIAAAGVRLPYAGFATNRPLTEALRQYPQYTTVNGDTASGHSTYNALETSFQKRFSKGLWSMLSYTFSKTLVSVQGMNVFNKLTEKEVSNLNRPHIFSLAYIYDLPFGKGKQFMANAHPVVNGVLGGWTISAVHRYQSGAPISVGGCSQQLYGAGNARCNYVPGVPLTNPNWDRTVQTSPFLNRAAFVQPANGVYGDVPGRIPTLYEPAQLNEDLAVSKNFPLGSVERRNIEFRASAFNVSNRHLLGGLTTGINSATFGTFSNPQANLPRNLQFSLRLSF